MIQVKYDERLRAVATCLLFTPYADANNSHRPHPLRATILEQIEPYRDHPCAEFFRELVAAGCFGSRFYCLAVQLTAQPPFSWVAPTSATKRRLSVNDVFVELGVEVRFPRLLTEFFDDAKLTAVWETTSADWETVRRQVQQVVDECAIDAWQESFWGATPKQLVVAPNPTDPPYFGFAADNEREAFCIIGPDSFPTAMSLPTDYDPFDYTRDIENTVNLIVHEFGHIFLRSARRQIAALARSAQDCGFGMELRGWFPRMYTSLAGQLEEIVVRAVQGIFRAERTSRAAGDSLIQREMEQFGIELLRPVYESMLQARADGKRLGPERCVALARPVILGRRAE